MNKNNHLSERLVKLGTEGRSTRKHRLKAVKANVSALISQQYYRKQFNKITVGSVLDLSY